MSTGRALITGLIWFVLPLIPYSLARLADRLTRAGRQ